MNGYEQLMAEIDPEVVADLVHAPYQEAFRTTEMPDKVNTPEEFYAALGKFYKEFCLKTGNSCGVNGVEEARKILGEEKSEKVFLEDALKNYEQGFYGCANRIYEYLLRRAELSYLSAVTRKYIPDFYDSYEARERFAVWFVEKYLTHKAIDERVKMIMVIANSTDEFLAFFYERIRAARHP